MRTEINLFKEANDYEYVISHCFPALREPTCDNEILKGTFLDLEIVYFVSVERDGKNNYYAISKKWADENALTEEAIRKCAWTNTRNTITCTPIEEVLKMPVEMPIYMVTSTANDGFHGASAALICTEKLKELSQKLGVRKLYVIPSSIYELVVVPEWIHCADFLDDLIQSVNSSCVDECDRLTDHFYLFDSVHNAITI